ncbi:MAG: hypothetical protein ACLURP_08500 [Ruminococcus sp.]
MSQMSECIFDSRTMHCPGGTIAMMYAEYYYSTIEEIKDGIITYKQEDYPKDVWRLLNDRVRKIYSSPRDLPWQSDDRPRITCTWCVVRNPKYKSAERIHPSALRYCIQEWKPFY